MSYIVRVISEETFRGDVTGYVGPFVTAEEAIAYAEAQADPELLVECHVEELHSPA